ncbi:MAG: RNA polymerase sigma factor [Xanthomonadales bacterium]|nr:RNA polymerase sigma factor [Xanthomonadales bacterium]
MATQSCTEALSFGDTHQCLSDAYSQHSQALKNYLMMTVSEADAQDLMHDVYLRMANHPNLFQIQNIRAFMFTTATNLLRDRWRKTNAKFAPTLVNYEDCCLSDEANDPCEVTDWQDRLKRVRQAISQLPAKTKQAFELSRIQNRSYAEIADQLQVSVNMIEKHISFALNRIRPAL